MNNVYPYTVFTYTAPWRQFVDVARPDGGAFVPRCVGDAILKVLGSLDMVDL